MRHSWLMIFLKDVIGPRGTRTALPGWLAAVNSQCWMHTMLSFGLKDACSLG